MSERLRSRILPITAAALLAGAGIVAAPRQPPKNPATITIDVAPEAVRPGGEARVTLRLAPKEGIKIARYPQIKLQVPAQAGLAAGAETRIGSSKPPAPDKLESNYWHEVDPVELTLKLDEALAPGKHELDAKLTYFFCVSGDFCAPARVQVKIPLAVD